MDVLEIHTFIPLRNEKAEPEIEATAGVPKAPGFQVYEGKVRHYLKPLSRFFVGKVEDCGKECSDMP